MTKPQPAHPQKAHIYLGYVNNSFNAFISKEIGFTVWITTNRLTNITVWETTNAFSIIIFLKI
ncbi:hypothetical protein V2J09_018887 [Rumex salicifolius]